MVGWMDGRPHYPQCLKVADVPRSRTGYRIKSSKLKVPEISSGPRQEKLEAHENNAGSYIDGASASSAGPRSLRRYRKEKMKAYFCNSKIAWQHLMKIYKFGTRLHRSILNFAVVRIIS